MEIASSMSHLPQRSFNQMYFLMTFVSLLLTCILLSTYCVPGGILRTEHVGDLAKTSSPPYLHTAAYILAQRDQKIHPNKLR